MRVTLRPATPADSERVRRWRNHPSVYRHLFASAPVTKAEHESWFAARLADRRSRLLIAMAAGKPVGQIRLDAVRRRRSEIGVAVAPEAWGRGIGTAAIREAAAPARRLGARALEARILVENLGSTVAFLKAGYRFVRLARTGRRLLYVLEKKL